MKNGSEDTAISFFPFLLIRARRGGSPHIGQPPERSTSLQTTSLQFHRCLVDIGGAAGRILQQIKGAIPGRLIFFGKLSKIIRIPLDSDRPQASREWCQHQQRF